MSFADRDLCNTSPLSEQFAPEDSQLIRQNTRMAGVTQK